MKPAPAQIAVSPSPPPTDNRHLVESAKFLLELAVTARNADACRYRVIVSYNGVWGDRVWDHLIVDQPEVVKVGSKVIDQGGRS